MLSDLEFAGYNRAQIEDIERKEKSIAEFQAINGQRLRRIKIKLDFTQPTGSYSNIKELEIEMQDTEGLDLNAVLEQILMAVNSYKHSLQTELDELVDDYIRRRALNETRKEGE